MRRFLSFSEVALTDAGITSQQYQALLVIKAAPEGRVVMRELADQMLLQHNGAVQLADRLVPAGLAQRIPVGGGQAERACKPHGCRRAADRAPGQDSSGRNAGKRDVAR